MDWMGEDPSIEEGEKQKALDFAKLYLVFETHPAAKAILAQWDKTLRRRRIAVNASLQEYAAHCAQRDFVEAIHQQIELAHNEGRLP
jgi:hypothetical protein